MPYGDITSKHLISACIAQTWSWQPWLFIDLSISSLLLLWRLWIFYKYKRMIYIYLHNKYYYRGLSILHRRAGGVYYKCMHWFTCIIVALQLNWILFLVLLGYICFSPSIPKWLSCFDFLVGINNFDQYFEVVVASYKKWYW